MLDTAYRYSLLVYAIQSVELSYFMIFTYPNSCVSAIYNRVPADYCSRGCCIVFANFARYRVYIFRFEALLLRKRIRHVLPYMHRPVI